MSHTVAVILIADQTIFLLGHEINIHDLESVTLDNDGDIIEFRCSGKNPVHKASRVDSTNNPTNSQTIARYVFFKAV